MTDEPTPPGKFRRRRANFSGGRSRRHVVYVAPAEGDLLAQLAEQQGVTVPRLLVESALAGDRETASARRDAIVELFAVRRLLAAVSNNVNQVARHANATEDFPDEAAAVLTSVRRLVTRIDGAVDALAEPVRAREILEAARAGAMPESTSETDWSSTLAEPDGGGQR